MWRFRGWWGAWWCYPWLPRPWWGYGAWPYTITPEVELSLLRSRAQWLESELEAVRKRIEEIEKKQRA